jgi:RHS repeat-associated protein
VDGQGSTRVITDATGTSLGTYTYDAFGLVLAQTGNVQNVYLYAGEQFDGNVGAYYLRARYYDMANGRFLSVDPFSGLARNPMSLHRYLYGSADPVNNTDPSGRFTLIEIVGVVAIIGVVTALALHNGNDYATNLIVIDQTNWAATVSAMEQILNDYDTAHPDFTNLDCYIANGLTFDSPWHTKGLIQRYVLTGGPNALQALNRPGPKYSIIGNDLNYYFQGMLAKHYGLSESAMNTIISLWKGFHASQPSQDALEAAHWGWILSSNRSRPYDRSTADAVIDSYVDGSATFY